LDRFEKEKFIKNVNGKYSITNMGAILFAKNINIFPDLSRKAIRVNVYEGIDRFIDEYKSRNEDLASFMRRIGICEEKGSGIDKVIFNVELYPLPAPNFEAKEVNTKVTMYAYKDG
jgi:predicted HTH transcriptional regulator